MHALSTITKHNTVQRRRDKLGGTISEGHIVCNYTKKIYCPFDEQLRHEILEKYYFLHFFVYINIKISKILFTISNRCLQRINACKNMYSNITKWKS